MEAAREGHEEMVALLLAQGIHNKMFFSSQQLVFVTPGIAQNLNIAMKKTGNGSG